LSALKTQSHRLRETGAVEAADRLDRAIDAMRATVEAELTRSRLAGQSRGGSAPVLDVVEQLVQVLEQTEAGEALAFSVDIPETLTAPLGRDDLTDLLGPLMENAARFARRRVALSALQDDNRLALIVEDDGPGIPLERVGSVSGRGVRLDEQAAGQGLGLSIARSYAENTGGTLLLTRSVLGGLRVEICWGSPDARL
jgi:signal transduction histidine kinase